MSDEEDFDEFPSIEVNSPLAEAKSFLMPSAEAVAAARAREADTERELRRLQEEHPGVCALAHATSDSSGSEGEAALAAAVAALRVLPPPRAPPAAPPPHVLAALAHALSPPSPLLHHYMDATRDRSEADVARLTREVLRDVSEMAYETASASDVQLWPEEEYLGVCTWTCALAAAGGGGGALRRTLHVLLDDVGSEAQTEALRGVLARAAGALGARAVLLLCSALQSGSERGARLAADLAVRALAALANLPHDQEVTLEACGRALGGGAWRRLAPPQRYLALQLLARGGGGAGARGALAALQAAPQQQGRAHSADMLKVLVAASKLSVLFHEQE